MSEINERYSDNSTGKPESRYLNTARDQQLSQVTNYVLHDIAGSLTVLKYNLHTKSENSVNVTRSLNNADFIRDIIGEWHDPGSPDEFNLVEEISSVVYFLRSMLISKKVEVEVLESNAQLSLPKTAFKRFVFNILLSLLDIDAHDAEKVIPRKVRVEILKGQKTVINFKYNFAFQPKNTLSAHYICENQLNAKLENKQGRCYQVIFSENL